MTSSRTLIGLLRKNTVKTFLFLILSDHGFTEQITEVNLNAFLKDKGFLVTNESREYYDKIDTGTMAFAMDPGRIYIHHEKKVSPGSRKTLRGRAD